MQLFVCGVNHHTAPVAIRERVARGWSIRYWTPGPVAAYIAERGLYRGAAEAPCSRRVVAVMRPRAIESHPTA